MNEAPHIRDARVSDAAEIARLSAELGYPISAAEMRTRLVSLLGEDSQQIAVAATTPSTLVGWVAAEHRLLLEYGERVDIVGLVVDPAARRSGIGRALVTEVEIWAASRKVSTVFVRSNVVRNESHGFYEGIGYDRTKTQHAYTKSL